MPHAASVDPAVLRAIVDGTAAETGEGFFDALCRHMAEAMRVKATWVTEWHPEERRLCALSFWDGERFVTGFEYGVAGTPCEPVIENRTLVHVPDRIVELYSADPSLEPLGAVSYLGVPLFDTDDEILGHLAVLHDEPLDADESLLGIFRIFAGRAAAELRRKRRDQALREREQKHSRLLEGAMDAIIELDAERRISHLNAAAATVFDAPAGDLPGRPFDSFLMPESRGKLAYLIAQLERQPDGRKSLWIPNGLQCVTASKKKFPADATISCWGEAGVRYYTVVLRDVHEQAEAQERIRSLSGEADYLRSELASIQGFDEIIGESPALRAVLADVERVAGSDAAVLVTGETGTGKELIARAIHRRSPRSSGPLIAVNCAAIPENLQESEFFGHEKGAFTGALQQRDGRFLLADGGTIFLDEVGEMGLDLQAKLLRVLQEGIIEPVGGSRQIRVDVRVVAATNRDLARMVEEGTFRADLMYRLDVFPLHLPPLRERGRDVLLIAEAIVREIARRRGTVAAPLTEAMQERLLRYEWPGNVRELRNVIERAFITSADGRTLNLGRALPDAGPAPAQAGSEGGDAILTEAEMKDLERRNIGRALAAAKGRISGAGGAAELLGVNPNTLTSRMKTLGVERPR
jgi:PAS domain S-box-containing protein